MADYRRGIRLVTILSNREMLGEECSVCGAAGEDGNILYRCDRIVPCDKINCAKHSFNVEPRDDKARIMLHRVKHICEAHIGGPTNANAE